MAKVPTATAVYPQIPPFDAVIAVLIYLTINMKKLLAKRDDASPVDPWAIPRFTIARA
jgi:hypothetical protein